MTSAGIPKLADFGQSRALNNSQAVLKTTEYSREKGTVHWMAYELLDFIEDANAQVICTKESDIWAFGMVIYASRIS